MDKFARTMSSEITQNSSQESSRPMWLWQAVTLKPVVAYEGPQWRRGTAAAYRKGFTHQPLKIAAASHVK